MLAPWGIKRAAGTVDLEVPCQPEQCKTAWASVSTSHNLGKTEFTVLYCV